MRTDKSDYSPARTSRSSGRGFQPGETINLVVRQTYPGGLPDRSLVCVADASGAFVNSDFVVGHAGSQHDAVGDRDRTSSGRSAEAWFTDALAFARSEERQSDHRDDRDIDNRRLRRRRRQRETFSSLLSPPSERHDHRAPGLVDGDQSSRHRDDAGPGHFLQDLRGRGRQLGHRQLFPLRLPAPSPSTSTAASCRPAIPSTEPSSTTGTTAATGSYGHADADVGRHDRPSHRRRERRTSGRPRL